jgi:hypothetical protein
MAYAASSNQELFIYAVGALAIVLLVFIGAAMWRQVTRFERASQIITEFVARSTGMAAAAGTPVPARSTTTLVPPIPAQPPSLPDVSREESATPDDEPARSSVTPAEESDSEPDLDPHAVLDALNGADDPLTLLREVESELAALGGLAEGARPGQGAEFLDVPGALGPTLSLAARRIGVAVDLLELRQVAISEATRR